MTHAAVLKKYYTGVGTRSTPEEFKDLIGSIAYKLSTIGYVLRTGDAEGADKFFRSPISDQNLKQVFTAKDAEGDEVAIN